MCGGGRMVQSAADRPGVAEGIGPINKSGGFTLGMTSQEATPLILHKLSMTDRHRDHIDNGEFCFNRHSNWIGDKQSVCVGIHPSQLPPGHAGYLCYFYTHRVLSGENHV